MRKLKLYLDTSAISHIDAPDRRDWEAITGEFYRFVKEHPDEFELVASPITLFEIDQCPEPKRSSLYDFLSTVDFTILPENQEALSLADLYAQEGILAKKHSRDLTHVAYATVVRCDYVVSWNMKHLVKARTISGVNLINRMNNYCDIIIMTPLAFIGEQSYEND